MKINDLDEKKILNFLKARYTKENYIKNENYESEIVYKNAAVSSESHLASKVGVNILKQGGNAIDAAIASMVCIGIINQFSSGIGGGGFMLIMDESNKDNVKYHSIDFRETAPQNINIEDYMRNPKNSVEGGCAVCVPGEIRGMLYAHRKFGKLPWKKLFEENILIAKKFRVTKELEKRLRRFKDTILKDKGLRETYSRDGDILKEGDFCYRENLSKTLKIISEDPEAFYTGELANSMIKFIKEKGGCMTKKDLMDYEVISRDIIKSEYKGYEIITTDLPTGGIFVLEVLNILKKFNLYNNEKDKNYLNYHILIEILKFTYAGRADYCDPEFLENKDELIKYKCSEKRANYIARKINQNKVLNIEEYELKPGFIYDHGTSHLNVLDKENISVLVTTSINLEFGAKILDPTTGICFNNTIDDFYVPNVRNAYDIEISPKNIIFGGKRPFSSISPIIFRKNNEKLLIGGAGGSRIPSSVILAIFYMELGLSLKEAIISPRIHHQFNPNLVYVENTFPEEIKRELMKYGHEFFTCSLNSSFTSIQAIYAKENETNEKIITAYSDPRKGGLPDGF